MVRNTQGSWDDVKIFKKKGARVSDPKITITGTYTILFGSAFCHRAGLEDKKRVILGYSPSNNAIIFDFTEDEKAEGAFRVVHRNKNTAFTTCRSFFHSFELDINNVVGRYQPQLESIPKLGKLWTIDLDKKLEK